MVSPEKATFPVAVHLNKVHLRISPENLGGPRSGASREISTNKRRGREFSGQSGFETAGTYDGFFVAEPFETAIATGCRDTPFGESRPATVFGHRDAHYHRTVLKCLTLAVRTLPVAVVVFG